MKFHKRVKSCLKYFPVKESMHQFEVKTHHATWKIRGKMIKPNLFTLIFLYDKLNYMISNLVYNPFKHNFDDKNFNTIYFKLLKVSDQF